MGAVRFGEHAITSAPAQGGADGFALHGDSVRFLAPFGGLGESIIMLATAEDIGIWSAVYNRYVLRRHTWPSGALADSVIVERDWFPGPEGNEGNLFDLHADDRGLLWIVAGAADPTAPGPWSSDASMEERVIDENLDERAARSIRYRDIVIEAFTPKGNLVASARFDSYSDAAEPIRGNLWYRTSADDMTIIVLEALLVDRGRSR